MPGKQKATDFYCGTSNVELPVANKSHLPADFQTKSRLHYYATLFNSVEINRSFYKIPMRRTVERRAADVPAHFKFTFKLWQGITHANQLAYARADLNNFMHSIDGAGAKSGCVLIQLPASTKFARALRLRKLLDHFNAKNKNGKWRVAVEFRDASWYNDHTYEMLAHHHAAIVMHDMPKSATPSSPATTDFSYLRFHGELGDYRGTYPVSFLEQQCRTIDTRLKNGQTVFAYFNNTIGDAVNNALALRSMCKW